MPACPLGQREPSTVAASVDGRLVGDMGRQGPGAIGIAVDFGHHAVHDLDLDAAVGVALLADGIDLVFRKVMDICVPARSIGKSLAFARSRGTEARAAAREPPSRAEVFINSRRFNPIDLKV